MNAAAAWNPYLAPNYAPLDTSIEEAAFEQACENAMAAYMESGKLPQGMDASTVDDELFGSHPDVLHELSMAYEKGGTMEFLRVATRLAEKRRSVIEEQIIEALKAA